jgi:hypothetical protein
MSEFAFNLVVRALDANGIDPDNIDVNTKDPMKIGMSRKYCKVGKCPEAWQTMEYRPNIAGNVIYMLLLLVLFVGQAFLGIRHKTWKYMAALCLGLLGEMIGYVGRLMLNQNPFIMNNFLV